MLLGTNESLNERAAYWNMLRSRAIIRCTFSFMSSLRFKEYGVLILLLVFYKKQLQTGCNKVAQRRRVRR